MGHGLQNRQRHSRSLVAILTCVALAAPAAARAWSWPVQGPVLQSFDFDELNPKAPGQHRGISIGSPTGTPVLAPVDATVTFAGTVPAGGKTLSLLTAQGLSVTLVHLGSFSVLRGATVAEGQEVGRVGPSGVSELTVPYVYLGVRRVEDPQGYLDPLLFLPTTQVPPAPVEPPAPAPGPAPAPVAPPVQEVPPPAPAPVAPPAEQPSPPRSVLPSAEAPERPLPTPATEPSLKAVPSGNVPAPAETVRASAAWTTAPVGIASGRRGRRRADACGVTPARAVRSSGVREARRRTPVAPTPRRLGHAGGARVSGQ